MIHIVMFGILAALIHGVLSASGYVVMLRKNLEIAVLPVIRKRVPDGKVADILVYKAKQEHKVWTTMWLPLFVLSTLNTIGIWYLLADDQDVNNIYLVGSVLAISWTFTVTFTGKIGKQWVTLWNIYLSTAQCDLLLERLMIRLHEIKAKFDAAATGSALSVSELDDLLSETAILAAACDEITAHKATLTKMLSQFKVQHSQQDNTQR